MGIIGSIAKMKQSFHQTRVKIVQGKTARLQEANLREAELTKATSEYHEARQIRADLRAEQMKPIEGEKPSKLKALGQGMAKHMNKTSKKMTKSPKVGVPRAGSPGGGATAQGGIFGGQKNIDVGGEKGSPFNQQNSKKIF